MKILTSDNSAIRLTVESYIGNISAHSNEKKLGTIELCFEVTQKKIKFRLNYNSWHLPENVRLTELLKLKQTFFK